MNTQIPYNSYIVLINTNESSNNDIEYTTWLAQLALTLKLAANLNEYIQMVSNINTVCSYYINNAETKQQLIKIYNSASLLEKDAIDGYVKSLSNAFLLIQFPVYLNALFTACTFIDKNNKNTITIDYNQIVLALSINLGITTSSANLQILNDITKNIATVPEKIDAVNGLDFIILITADPTVKDSRETMIDYYVTNSTGPIDQYNKINSSVYGKDDDIDGVLYQEVTMLNIMKKYTFLKVYLQNILKMKNAIVSIVLVPPTDTTFVKLIRRIVGIIIGLSFICIIPIVFSLFYYVEYLKWNSDAKNVCAAIVLLILLYILMYQFDTLDTTLFKN